MSEYPPPPPPAGPPPQGPPPQGPPPPGMPPPGQPYLTPDEVTWGGAAHWSALVASVVAMAFLGPLIIMLTKGAESAWVRRQAVESLNFQLSVLVYGLVSFVLCFVLVGFVLLPIVGLLWLICTILASVRVARGEDYRYPVTIRMVS
ncbi:MAG: DUF4870 domain-containing protein [Nocardioides sp.]